MKFFKVGDKVKIKNPKSLIGEEELDPDLKDFVIKHEKDIFVIKAITGTEGDGSIMYIVVSGNDMSPSGGFYSSELELVTTSEWDK